MRIFTRKAFQEELAKIREERDKEEWLRNQFRDMEDNVARLERDIAKLRMEVSQIRDGDKNG